MEDDDESSLSNIQKNYNLRIDGTPNNSKRLRTKSFENDMHKLSETQIPTYNNQNRDGDLARKKQMTSSNQEYDYPPISLKFKNETQSSDRQLINELITWWKTKHGTDLNVMGRFGYKKCLLVFANDAETFDDIAHKSKWPEKIQGSEYEIKLPRVFPPSYSLVVQHFPKNWDEIDTAEELKERYPSLMKLTRMFGRQDTALNSIRADFHSLQQVQSLLQDSFIVVSQMRLPVKLYYQPARIKKCMRCFSHEHPTNRCTNQQVCIRCGQQHSFDNNCQNEIKCVNCQQRHYAGHSSCPVVQQKRRQLSEQQKINRSNLLINASSRQYEVEQADFPIPIFAGVPPPVTQGNYAAVTKQQIRPRPSLQPSSNEKESRRNEHIEQIILTSMSKIESRLLTLESSLTLQLSELENKIDLYSERLDKLECVVYDLILPAIQSISEVAAASSRTGNIKQQLTNITKSIIAARQIREQKSNHASRDTHIDSTPTTLSNEHGY